MAMEEDKRLLAARETIDAARAHLHELEARHEEMRRVLARDKQS